MATTIKKGARGLGEKAGHGTNSYIGCPDNIRFQGSEVHILHIRVCKYKAVQVDLSTV